MNPKSQRFEILLGALVLTVVALFVPAAYFYQYRYDQSFVAMQADFDSVEGLTKGAAVKVNGVSVGEVTGISLVPETFSVKVTFKIDKTIPVAQDSMATISGGVLLGSAYLNLILGNESKVLGPGEIISVTQPPVSLESLLQKFLFSTNDAKEG